MKKMLLMIVSLICCTMASGQQKLTFGAGYYGETITHPGIVLQAEYENGPGNTLSMPVRLNVGYYIHKRNHEAVFSDLVTGLRWHVSPRWYTGVHGGVGIMLSWHHSDAGVFRVDDTGNVSRTSNFAGIDLMPSAGLEFGYTLRRSATASDYIWIRPKAFWQMNVNQQALFHAALEIGYTFNL